MKAKKAITLTALVLMVGAWGFLKFKTATQSVLNESSGPKTLYLYAVSAYFPEKILKAFEAKYNCHVQYDYFSGNEELLAKLQAGASGYDVLVPSDFTIKALGSSGLIVELDRTKIPNFKNIAPEFLGAPYDPENKYSVPYKWGTTGFVYNTDKIKENLTSWDQVFQPKYSGRVSLLDDPREAIGAQLFSLGFSVNSINADELKQARELFMKRKRMVKVFATDPRQILQSGDVWIAQAFSGDAAQVKKENPAFKYVVPTGGAVIWVDTLTISKGARNIDLAYKFINFMLEPEIEKMNVSEILYASPNRMVEDANFDESLKPSYTRKLDLRRLEFIKDLGIDGQKWDQLWTEIKSN